MSDWDGRKVPIQRDSRTFEQRRRDLLVKLHQSFGCRSNLNTNDELDEVNSPIYECYQPQHPPNWFEDLNQWVDAMQKDWDREIQRIRNDMFQLLPVDWVNEDADELTQHEDVPSILDRMEREMEMMRHHTGSTSNVERKHRKLCGVGDRGPEEDASVPYLSGGPLDYLKDVYEVDENGQIRFIVRFDVVGYGPEDIQVNTSSHGLTVHAKKSLQNETETNTQEYIRTVYLPSSIDKNHFVGHLSEDGVLVLEAPVNLEAHKSLTFNGDRQLAVKPQCNQESSLSRDATNVTSMTIQLTGNCGPTVLQNDVTGERKVHVEVPIEPEFSADDLCVRMDANCVIVSGRKQCVNETETSQNAYVKEFTRSYKIPETVDTFSVNTQLHGNTLLVEAPLLYSVTSH